MSEVCTGGQARSRLVSTMLAGAWRSQPQAPDLSLTELEIVAPLLIGSGGGALSFWKLRGTELETTPPALELKQAYRLYTLQAAIHEREIEELLSLLEAAGIDPLLVKGWAIARQFPEAALRPYGDIDLFVRPEDFSRAEDLLKSPEGRKFFVDLHLGAKHLDAEPLEALYERSEVLKLGAARVRVLSPEDHLRVLAVHFLHHGAWRPAALCDIGLLVEKYRGRFDWQVCLTGNHKRASWVAGAVGLAHELLGASLDETPLNAKKLPTWLVPAVLKEWENPVSVEHIVPPPLAERLAHPLETLSAIRRRWPPNPIQATIVMNGGFNEWPRLVYQTGDFVTRTAKFLAGLPGRAISREKGTG